MPSSPKKVMQKNMHSVVLKIAAQSFCVILFACLFATCTNKHEHFLTDQQYRDQVHQQFLKRKEMARGRSQQLFAIFDKKELTAEQTEALEFLYAYMPLCDLGDYDANFFLSQINTAFAARDEFSWGKSIPEDVFRHFVLVYRVNNENLDSARTVFYKELKDRIKNMSMHDAALEVNHWCHEKVMYKPSDERTSAPLASLCTSWGRCGEESTFAVTALRAVGIPARQCYTPRWAHTDDNHAWVEVWIDGKWHYMGACEPEAELDMAWFTGPAKRAMMVHTNVFGMYNGSEEKNLTTSLYSKINLLSNYTATKKLQVKVVDKNNRPVGGTTVKFKVYNYAEYYPIAEGVCDATGNASIITSLGDLMVWENNGEVFGYAKALAGSKDVLTIILDKKRDSLYNEQLELIPPVEQTIKEAASADKVQQNAKRLAYEDSLRNAYVATFANQDYAKTLAAKLNMKADTVWYYIQKSYGNWKQIETFFTANNTKPYLLAFLAALSDKDLRDSRAEILQDHFDNALKTKPAAGLNEKFIADYIMSPHIANELIRPWRNFLQAKFDSSFKQQVLKDGQNAVSWVMQNIQLKNDENYYNCPVSPQGVYELKVADAKSRNIFFVALCRSAGLPARIEQSTGKPQYFQNGQWIDAVMSTEQQPKQSVMEKLTLKNVASNVVKPEYASHYTIAKYVKGDFVTLDYEESPLVKTLPCTLSLDTGYYKLMMGSRANDGSVTVKTTYFKLEKGKPMSMDLSLPVLEGKLQVLGIIDMNTTITLNNKTQSLKSLANGKGIVLCIADPAKEPTRHVLNDMPTQKKDFETWGGGVLFMVPDDKLTPGFDASAYKNLPQQTIWGTDKNRQLLKSVTDALRLNLQDNFPITMYITADGKILFYSAGYRIGIGENLLKAIFIQKQTCAKP